MKTKTCIFAILLAAGLTSSRAQDTWTQKADFGGGGRYGAIGFSIGSIGYIGTGYDFNLGHQKDLWAYDPSTNAWTQKANLGGVARESGVGFVINGKGYVGTGYNFGGVYKDFWEYDPVSNTWTQKADFGGTARYVAVGFSVAGKGYIGTGSATDGIKKDFWEYDPSANSWTQRADFGGAARWYSTGFSVNSKGYIGTGFDGVNNLKDFWEYDPSTNAWTQKADFGGTARVNAGGISIGTKGYFVCGNDGSLKRDFWEYDPSANSWTQRADFGGAARWYPAGFSIGSKGYVGTGIDYPTHFRDFWEYTSAATQTPGTWTATGSMNTARVSHTATLLSDGKVLVAGGLDATNFATSSAELYDPATGLWIPTGSMTTARLAYAATLLPSGEVLVEGGYDASGVPTSSAELYDPNTGAWTPTGSMNTVRFQHMATLISGGPLSGMVIVGGGVDSNSTVLASAELYDPITGVWSFTGSMTIARYFNNPSPTTLPEGSVLIVGGIESGPHWFNRAETYDSVTQQWTSTSSKTTRANEATVLLPDGKVLVAGGVTGTAGNSVNVADAELFDPSTGTWAATAFMSIDRFAHRLTLLASGQVLVAGGSSGGWSNFNPLSSAELYDSIAGTWFLTGSMTDARFAHTATLLPNGQVLVAGGYGISLLLSSAELYTPLSAAVVSLSQTALAFKTQLVGTTSKQQSVTLTNAGSATLTISSIAASGDFLAHNNCGSSVPPGASCTINVRFSPTAKGVRAGTVTITDDAADSPQMIKLTGIGTVVQLSPSALDFGNQIVGTTSDPHAVTITNTGSEDLRIFGIGFSGENFGDFAETTTCGSNLAAGGSCTIDITFTPTAKGRKHANLWIKDDGGGSQQAVPLTGTGVLH